MSSTDRRTDRRTDKVNPVYPPPTSLGGGIILKVTSLKMNRLLPMATINMHMKFEIEIPKQTWLMLRKPCRLQTDGRTDGRTRWIQYTPPPTSLGGGIMITSDLKLCACHGSPGPCITIVFVTCRKNFSQWHRSFQRKLHFHWLKFLRHVAITLVIQGPALVDMCETVTWFYHYKQKRSKKNFYKITFLS